MANEKRITAVGYITITGMVSIKDRKIRHTHTARLGFAGGVLKSGLRKLSMEFKKALEKQLRTEYADYDYNLKMTSRVTLTECDMLIDGKENETACN